MKWKESFSGLPGLSIHRGTIIQWHQSEKVKKTLMFVSVMSLKQCWIFHSSTLHIFTSLFCVYLNADTHLFCWLACEGMLQGHSLIWHFIHIQISSLIYTFSSTSVINASFCKASVWLLGNKRCKSHWEMYSCGSLTMAARACRWQKTKDRRWIITPSFLIAVIQMCTTFTYTDLSMWNKYLISTRTNALMIDFLTLQVVIQVTKHKSEWMCSSAPNWSVHLTTKNIQFHTSYWILRGRNKPLLWLDIFRMPRKLLIWFANGSRVIETILLISLIAFAVPSVWGNWMKGF